MNSKNFILSALTFLVGTAAGAGDAEKTQQAVWASGTLGYHTYRIPVRFVFQAGIGHSPESTKIGTTARAESIRILNIAFKILKEAPGVYPGPVYTALKGIHCLQIRQCFDPVRLVELFRWLLRLTNTMLLYSKQNY